MNLSVENITNYTILFVKLFITRIWSLFYASKDIWLISERGNEARDNGYFFFMYLKREHPELESYFVITQDSPDFYKLIEYKDCLIEYRSLKHFLMVWRSKKLISTHVMGSTPDRTRFNKLDKSFNIFHNKKKIFLQHGIIKDLIPFLYADKNNIDLFVCGAKIEYDYILEKYGYTSNVVKYTGLCRFDNLNQFICKEQILIMPTWRHYIDKTHFEESEYYRQWAAVLTNPILAKITQKNNLKIIF